jgi:hypothetical protein
MVSAVRRTEIHVCYGLKADIARAQVMPSERLIGMARCNVRFPTRLCGNAC